MRGRWQRTCYELLRAAPDDADHRFLRRRLERWRISVLPRIRVSRFCSVLERLQHEVPPRVRAAVLRAGLNGWCTSRRFQGHGTCRFGCQAEDSIEHYACCPAVRDFARRRLNVEMGGLVGFLLLDAAPLHVVTKRAIVVATVYIAHCRARHCLTPDVIHPAALGQLACELVCGHPRAAATMARAFV